MDSRLRGNDRGQGHRCIGQMLLQSSVGRHPAGWVGCHVHAGVDMADPAEKTCLRRRKHGTKNMWA